MAVVHQVEKDLVERLRRERLEQELVRHESVYKHLQKVVLLLTEEVEAHRQTVEGRSGRPPRTCGPPPLYSSLWVSGMEEEEVWVGSGTQGGGRNKDQGPLLPPSFSPCLTHPLSLGTLLLIRRGD